MNNILTVDKFTFGRQTSFLKAGSIVEKSSSNYSVDVIGVQIEYKC